MNNSSVLRLSQTGTTALIIGLALLFVSLSAFADARSEWCSKSQNPEFFQNLASNPDNNLAFDNAGGWYNTGLCWWHSRFQRAAYYLTVYRPDLPKPTTWQAIHLLDLIMSMRGVVEIPGYKNFHEFTADWPKLIVNHLSMQETDAVWRRWTWLRHGILKPGPATSPGKLSRMMDELYDYVTVKKQIAYTMLQIKGAMAHAWLVVGMTKTVGGYVLKVVDSNFASEVLTVTYKLGDTTFRRFYSSMSPALPPSPGVFSEPNKTLGQMEYSFYGDFLPNLTETGDLWYFERARTRYCTSTKIAGGGGAW
ncbi:MAG: hypothetical protein ABL958_02115 [Bdellovibrionia bacterium]